jgi:protein-L-isoaspartate(D-aspartate) O-methyltransferase
LKREKPMDNKESASMRGAQALDRRQFVTAGAAALTAAVLPSPAGANVPVPYDWNASPPMDARTRFIEWMSANRGENPDFLGKRWDCLSRR